MITMLKSRNLTPPRGQGSGRLTPWMRSIIFAGSLGASSASMPVGRGEPNTSPGYYAHEPLRLLSNPQLLEPCPRHQEVSPHPVAAVPFQKLLDANSYQHSRIKPRHEDVVSLHSPPVPHAILAPIGRD